MQFDKAYLEGISKLTARDIRYAEELGYRIKLGHRPPHRQRASSCVHPTLIPEKRLIANVDGVMRRGDGGATPWAPPCTTAPALAACHRFPPWWPILLTSPPGHRRPGTPRAHLAFQPDRLADLAILPISEVDSCYLRVNVIDRAGVLASSPASWPAKASRSRR